MTSPATLRKADSNRILVQFYRSQEHYERLASEIRRLLDEESPFSLTPFTRSSTASKVRTVSSKRSSKQMLDCAKGLLQFRLRTFRTGSRISSGCGLYASGSRTWQNSRAS
jgi:hypothetical protein